MNRRYRAGQPVDLPMPIVYAEEEPDDGGMDMLAGVIVSLLLVLAAMAVGFIVGRYLS